MRWSETIGHQYLDEDGKPTAPVINYVGRVASENPIQLTRGRAANQNIIAA
jgi:hypothetical protein